MYTSNVQTSKYISTISHGSQTTSKIIDMKCCTNNQTHQRLDQALLASK